MSWGELIIIAVFATILICGLILTDAGSRRRSVTLCLAGGLVAVLVTFVGALS